MSFYMTFVLSHMSLQKPKLSDSHDPHTVDLKKKHSWRIHVVFVKRGNMAFMKCLCGVCEGDTALLIKRVVPSPPYWTLNRKCYQTFPLTGDTAVLPHRHWSHLSGLYQRRVSIARPPVHISLEPCFESQNATKQTCLFFSHLMHLCVFFEVSCPF